MPKTMTKYQLDHFKAKVRRNFNPLIEEQELLVKQYRTEATEKIVGKLAKKMGADKILNEFRKAEAQLKAVQDKARTFFKKKAEQIQDKKKDFNSSSCLSFKPSGLLLISRSTRSRAQSFNCSIQSASVIFSSRSLIL